MQGKRVKVLGITTAKRSPLVPDVPTIREMGYGADMTQTYFALVAPPGTPGAVAQKISDAIGETISGALDAVAAGVLPPDPFADDRHSDRDRDP